jgi:amino acid permease
MRKEQSIVAVGAGTGVISMIIGVFGIYRAWPAPEGLAAAAERVAYTLQWEAIAALPLLVAVIAVGNNRFLSEAIDPTLNKEDLATQINGRVVENTLQQLVLFVLGTLALSVGLAPEQMGFIPAAVIVFVIARIAFWIGYRVHPLYRAFGMAATGYLNVGLLGFAIAKMFA